MTRLCWQSAWRVTKSLSRQGCAPGTLRARQRKELLPKSRRHSHHTHFAHCCSQLRPPQTLTAHGRLGLRCHTMHEAGELQNAKAGAKGHQSEENNVWRRRAKKLLSLAARDQNTGGRSLWKKEAESSRWAVYFFARNTSSP